MKSQPRWTLERLEGSSGISKRTIRKWIAEGLLPSPVSRGRYAEYSERHLELIRRIKSLREEKLSLTEIRQLLQGTGGRALSRLQSALQYAGEQHRKQQGSSDPEGQEPARGLPRVLAARSELRYEDTTDRLRRELQRLVDDRSVQAKSKGEEWVRIPITPDVEITIRGRPTADQLHRFERIADYLREILQGGMK